MKYGQMTRTLSKYMNRVALAGGGHSLSYDRPHQHFYQSSSRIVSGVHRACTHCGKEGGMPDEIASWSSLLRTCKRASCRARDPCRGKGARGPVEQLVIKQTAKDL